MAMLVNLSPGDYLNLMLIVFFLIPFLFTVAAMPYIIRKLKENGHVVKDMYKSDQPLVPTQGGLAILLIAIFSLSILTLFYSRIITPINYTIIVIVVLFALFGLLDDLINIGRPANLSSSTTVPIPSFRLSPQRQSFFPLSGMLTFPSSISSSSFQRMFRLSQTW